MFRVESTRPNRIDIEINGHLTADEMRKGLDRLIDESVMIENGKMMYRISDFNFPSLGALGVELTYLPKLFGCIGKFRKAAVLADKAWLRNISEIEGCFLPGLKIKAFELNQVTEAEAWLVGS